MQRFIKRLIKICYRILKKKIQICTAISMEVRAFEQKGTSCTYDIRAVSGR